MTSHKKLPDIVERLEPCPFCGGANIVEGADTATEWYVACDDCQGQVLAPTQAASIAAWNLRAQRSDEARPSWGEAIEAAASASMKYAVVNPQSVEPWDKGYRAAAAAITRDIRALTRPSARCRYPACRGECDCDPNDAPARPSAPAEDGEGVREALRNLIALAKPHFSDPSQMLALELAEAALSPLHEGKKP
jgi:Lar family restriction alleviation protein